MAFHFFLYFLMNDYNKKGFTKYIMLKNVSGNDSFFGKLSTKKNICGGLLSMWVWCGILENVFRS